VLGRGSPTQTLRRCNQDQGSIKMLVLSRKVGEKVVIDGNITVEIVRIQGNRITLGFVAPAEVKILRAELNQIEAKSELTEFVVENGLLVAC
jgi:carbon storage regulator CsrA